MKNLIIARHGLCAEDGNLDVCGKSQIVKLSIKLELVLTGGVVCVLSSTVDRAVQSARIISWSFGVAEAEAYEILVSPPVDLGAVYRLVSQFKGLCTHLIIVTHSEYTKDLPAYFGRVALGVSFESHPLQPGQAWVIDCEEKTIRMI